MPFEGNRQGRFGVDAPVFDGGRSNPMMEYKGYVGRVDFDDQDGIFHGDVVNIRDVITFQGDAVEQLRHAFRASVEDYLAYCKERGEEPEKPYSGQFITRVNPALHRRISIAAALAGKSLNAWVAEQLDKAAQSLTNTAKSGRAKSHSRSKLNSPE
jgi:predicted HicB family RNase H-like nuclease